MTREKRRLTLDELKSLPGILWMLEIAQIWTEATGAGLIEIAEEADLLPSDPDLTPEKIVALGEKLRRATGSTVETTAAA
jgi:hypothetical protein